VRHLELTEIARADLKSIRRYSARTWGSDRTAEYMAALRDTMKGLLAGTVVSRNRHPPGLGCRWLRAAVTACSSRSTSHASSSFVCSTTEWTISVISKLRPARTRTAEIYSSRLAMSIAHDCSDRLEHAPPSAACRPAITDSMLPLCSAPSNALRVTSDRTSARSGGSDPAFRGAFGH
jgi:plasmid stabilization system protein ParE